MDSTVRKHLVVVVIALLFFALGFSAYSRYGGRIFVKENPHPLEIGGDSNNAKSIEALSVAATFNEDYSKELPMQPANGKWTVTDIAQISPKNVVIVFEDGHNANLTVINAEEKQILVTMAGQAKLSSDAWGALLAQYGAADLTPKFYALNVIRNGELVIFDKLTEVPENVILKPGVSGQNIDSGSMVTYTDNGFMPAVLTVRKGTTVTWKSNSEREMWPASDPHPTHAGYPEPGTCSGSAFDACKDIQPGGSYSFRFDRVGTWGYHDHLNPKFAGTIIVTE